MSPMRPFWRIYELCYVGLLMAETAEAGFIDAGIVVDLMSSWWFPVEWLFVNFEPYGMWLDMDVRIAEWAMTLFE